MKRDDLIVVRGGGDLATGVVHRLWSAGLRVLVLETAHPAAIRRQVSLCEAVYEGETAVEGMRGEYNETYHVFGEVKSMLKKKRYILRKMHLKYEE